MPINWRLKRLLSDLEMTQIELTVETSETLGVKRCTVRNVLTGHKHSKKIELHVSARLGTTRDFLFPSRRRQDEREKSARAEKLKCRVLLKEVENKSS